MRLLARLPALIALLAPFAALALDAAETAPLSAKSVTTNRLVIDGAGSTGDVSGMTAASGSTLRRLLQQRFAEIASVRDFGARCDGVTDDGPAFRAALAALRTVFVPVAGCTGPYLVDTTVTVPASKALVGQAPGRSVSLVEQPAMQAVTTVGGQPTQIVANVTDETGPGSIVTRANVDTFVTAGGGVTFEKLSVAHFGTSGSIIRSPGGTYLTIKESKLGGYARASLDPVVFIAGSSFVVADNLISNSRARASYALAIERTAAGVVIESYVERNTIDGRWIDTSADAAQLSSGGGIRVHSSVAGRRPEGIHINRNSIVTKGLFQLLVNACLSCTLEGNTFDLGRERTVVFDPVEIGIDTVSVLHNWFAAENNGGSVKSTGYGKCLEFANDHNTANGRSSGVANINVVGNQFHFCDTGITGTGSVNGLAITGNNFVSMSRWGANFSNANRVTFVGNVMANVGSGRYLRAADGPGGPYIITGNTFSGGATSELDLFRSAVERFFVVDNHGVTNSNVRDQTTRLAFTAAGVTINAGIGSAMLIPIQIVPAATITLPKGGYTGQPLEINNGAFATKALSFAPAVTNWTNGSTLSAYGRLSMRWDATAGAWVRFTPN